jgi:tRNA A-37 threonylcarbamoyl transferase component Bud32
MKTDCPNCGHSFDTQVAPGLKDACPRCMAEFLLAGTEDAVAASEAGHQKTDEALPLQPGDSLRGYEIVEFIGRGGMGFVYEARQAELERTVALKVLAPRLAKSPEFAERFTREARALAALSHPNIVQIHDYGREGELCFLVMEHVSGTSLRRILSTQRLSPETALRYVPQICDALEYAHANGVIHRDIKPENILIDERGNLKIADFGLAKMADPGRSDAAHATATGQVMGTPHYMAPEQIENMAGVDHRADIYSLGVVFYEMLTGELPLGKFPNPSQKVHVDVRFDEVVLKALQKEPEKRYQRASYIKDAVSTISGKGFPVSPVSGEKPRMSRLAIAGALGLPAAIITFVLLGALCVLFGGSFHDAESAAAGAVSGVVVLVGVVLSIAAGFAIRNQPETLRGMGLARLGTWLPVGLGIAIVLVGLLKYDSDAGRSRTVREKDMLTKRRVMEQRQAELAKSKGQSGVHSNAPDASSVARYIIENRVTLGKGSCFVGEVTAIGNLAPFTIQSGGERKLREIQYRVIETLWDNEKSINGGLRLRKGRKVKVLQTLAADGSLPAQYTQSARLIVHFTRIFIPGKGSHPKADGAFPASAENIKAFRKAAAPPSSSFRKSPVRKASSRPAGY